MPSLYALKPWYTRRLHRFVAGAVARGTSPDLFTVVGVVAAALAGVALAWVMLPRAVALQGALARSPADNSCVFYGFDYGVRR